VFVIYVIVIKTGMIITVRHFSPRHTFVDKARRCTLTKGTLLRKYMHTCTTQQAWHDPISYLKFWITLFLLLTAPHFIPSIIFCCKDGDCKWLRAACWGCTCTHMHSQASMAQPNTPNKYIYNLCLCLMRCNVNYCKTF